MKSWMRPHPYQGSPVCHFLPMWTHHDVTLQQQCRFDGHTQTSATRALKVTVDITMYKQIQYVTKHGQTHDQRLACLLICCHRLLTTNTPWLICAISWQQKILTICLKCIPTAWTGRSSRRGSNLGGGERNLDIASIINMKREECADCHPPFRTWSSD